jgi:hypothetical protein
LAAISRTSDLGRLIALVLPSGEWGTALEVFCPAVSRGIFSGLRDPGGPAHEPAEVDAVLKPLLGTRVGEIKPLLGHQACLEHQAREHQQLDMGFGHHGWTRASSVRRQLSDRRRKHLPWRGRSPLASSAVRLSPRSASAASSRPICLLCRILPVRVAVVISWSACAHASPHV